jgi:hypothetical protein
LYEPLAECIGRQRGGRIRSIGPIDSFLLFLHWLRSDNPMDAIAAAFKLSKNTLHARMLEVLDRVHDPLVTRFVTAQACAPLPVRGEHPACGFIVDATIQNRGRPVGTFEEAKRYLSGKHKLYCLKSQVITNRDGLAVLIVAGVPGAKHDFQLFRDNLAAVEELVASHPGTWARRRWCWSSRIKRGPVCPSVP